MKNTSQSIPSIENRTFLLFLMVCSLAFGWLLAPFFGALFWACAVAIIFHPFKNWLAGYLVKKPNTVAAITLFACCIIVVIPIITLITLTINEGQELLTKVKNEEINTDVYVEKFKSTMPLIDQMIQRGGLSLEDLKSDLEVAAKNVGAMLAKSSFAIGQSTINFALNLSIMLYIAFFLIRDGSTITHHVFRALPLGDARENLLFTKFAEVVRATVKGNLVVACIQGAIGGLTFWALDISGASLWMFVMAVAAMIPVFGAAIIWGPVALYLLLTGETLKGIVLILVGATIIGLIDNILRPILVGRDTKLPDYIVLISTLGGLALFGINGFIVGPIIAALFFVSWSIFIKEFQ